jgi:hypothetical protein
VGLFDASGPVDGGAPDGGSVRDSSMRDAGGSPG